MSSKFESVEKYIMPLREILDKKRQEVLLWFFIQTFLYIFTQVLIAANDEGVANLFKHMVNDVVPSIFT